MPDVPISDQTYNHLRAVSLLTDDDRWAALLLVAQRFPNFTPLELLARVTAAEQVWLNTPGSYGQIHRTSPLFWRAMLAQHVINYETDNELKDMTHD